MGAIIVELLSYSELANYSKLLIVVNFLLWVNAI